MEGTKTPVGEEGRSSPVQVSQASSLGSGRHSFCAYTPKTTSSKLPATYCLASSNPFLSLLSPQPRSAGVCLICLGRPSATMKLGQVSFLGVLSPCDLISITDKCLSHNNKGSRHRANQLQWVPQSSPLSCPLQPPPPRCLAAGLDHFSSACVPCLPILLPVPAPLCPVVISQTLPGLQCVRPRREAKGLGMTQTLPCPLRAPSLLGKQTHQRTTKKCFT